MISQNLETINNKRLDCEIISVSNKETKESNLSIKDLIKITKKMMSVFIERELNNRRNKTEILKRKSDMFSNWRDILLGIIYSYGLNRIRYNNFTTTMFCQKFPNIVKFQNYYLFFFFTKWLGFTEIYLFQKKTYKLIYCELFSDLSFYQKELWLKHIDQLKKNNSIIINFTNFDQYKKKLNNLTNTVPNMNQAQIKNLMTKQDFQKAMNYYLLSYFFNEYKRYDYSLCYRNINFEILNIPFLIIYNKDNKPLAIIRNNNQYNNNYFYVRMNCKKKELELIYRFYNNEVFNKNLFKISFSMLYKNYIKDNEDQDLLSKNELIDRKLYTLLKNNKKNYFKNIAPCMKIIGNKIVIKNHYNSFVTKLKDKSF